MLVSHWFKVQQAVVSADLVYRRLSGASEIVVGWILFEADRRVLGDAPESGRAKFVSLTSSSC